MIQSVTEAILSERYYDYIIPTTVLNSGVFSSLVPEDSYFLMMDSFYGILSAPVPSDPSIISFVNYSTIPGLFLPQDLSSLEVSGIIQAQTQTTLQLNGQGVLIGFRRTHTDRSDLGSDYPDWSSPCRLSLWIRIPQRRHRPRSFLR